MLPGLVLAVKVVKGLAQAVRHPPRDVNVAKQWAGNVLNTAGSSGSPMVWIRHRPGSDVITVQFSEPEKSAADPAGKKVKTPLPPHIKTLDAEELGPLKRIIMRWAGVTPPYIPWGNRTLSTRDYRERPAETMSFPFEMTTGEILRVTVHISEREGTTRIDLYVHNRGVPDTSN
jgi:hypothetical protein